MEITEIRVFLKQSPDKKLKAYVTVTFDNVFVVRNIKVIHGSGGLFIAMPSRRIRISCRQCGFKNEAGSRFCAHCAQPLEHDGQESSVHDAKAEHRDIAHPVNQAFRDYLQNKILDAYKIESDKAQGPSSEERNKP